MHKRILLIAMLLATTGAISQEVISSQGDSYSNTSGSIDFTLGEVIIDTETNGTNDITQGFHQTNWNFVGLEDAAPEYSATIYPNPTSDYLNIQVNEYKEVSYVLYDSQGKLISGDSLNNEKTSVPVNELPSGGYSLVLTRNNTTLKTFKLVKTH